VPLKFHKNTKIKVPLEIKINKNQKSIEAKNIVKNKYKVNKIKDKSFKLYFVKPKSNNLISLTQITVKQQLLRNYKTWSLQQETCDNQQHFTGNNFCV